MSNRKLLYFSIILIILSNYLLGEEENPIVSSISSSSYKYDQAPVPIHQWIVLQAFNKLPESQLKDEIKDYLPLDENSEYYSDDKKSVNKFSPPDGWNDSYDDPYEKMTALIEGAYEEDVPITNSLEHFWNPDDDYDCGLNIGEKQKSALQKAQDTFKKAKDRYKEGEKTDGYYWLGRTAHLLADLTVPAHVQLDQHAIGEDNYESFMADSESHYKHITFLSANTDIPDYSDPPGNDYNKYAPSDFNILLTNLMYSLGNFADDFDSDDENGDSTQYGRGNFNRGYNDLDYDEVFSSAYKVTILGTESRKLSEGTDYQIVKCDYSNDYSIIYTPSFHDEINDTSYCVKVKYKDGSSEIFYDINEDGIPNAVCGENFQIELESRAIGYTAALFQLFWDEVHDNSIYRSNNWFLY